MCAFVPLFAGAQDPVRFARALEHRNTSALDRWMKHEFRAHRKGTLNNTSSSSYVIHAPTHDSLVAWLRQQPGVIDAAWDKCLSKPLIWPGYATVGLRVRMSRGVLERCYFLQEGRTGTIDLWGWRPRVWRSREQLKYRKASACEGFSREQRMHCSTQ